MSADSTEEKDWRTEYLEVLRELESLQHAQTDERNQNNKLLLQIILSCAGRSSELDERIDDLKQSLRSQLTEDERHDIILNLASELPQFSRTDASNSQSNNTFAAFLGELSLPGEIGAEVIRLRKRQQDIEAEQDQLAIINDTIDLLKSHYKQGLNNETLLLHLLEHMCLPKSVRKPLQAIKDELLGGYADENEIKATIRSIAGIVSEVNRALQMELDQVQAYLSHLMKELLDIDNYLADSDHDQNESLKATEAFKESLSLDLNDLQENLSGNDDMESVRHNIDAHLQKLKLKLDDHLHDAEQRYQQAQERNQELDKKLSKMQERGDKMKKVIQKERQKAQTDALTGIPNRLAFDKQIQREFARCERYEQTCCLAVIDVDKFKSVNDNFGHKAGDKVLKTVAEVCAEHIRESDFLARYGGEEFVVLLPQTKLDDAVAAAEKLRFEIEKCHFHYNDDEVPVTISIGIAEYQTEDAASSLFERADKCLYEAKESGRNRCVAEQSAKAQNAA